MKAAIALLFAWALATPTLAADVTVIASVGPPAIRIGEVADLIVTVQGRQTTKRPTVGNTAGLRVQYVGPSSQVSIVNGRMSTSVTHRLVVSGTTPGRYVIGPIQVEVDGQIYNAGNATIEILQPGASPPPPPRPQQPSRDEVELSLSIPRTEVYLHERVPVTVTLRIGAVRVDDLRYPEITSDGFAIEPFGEPKQQREQGPNGMEHVIVFTTSLKPLKEGALTVGPVTMALSVAVPSRRRSPFSGIFGDEMRPTQVATDPVTLSVLPLPAEGRPPKFSGAVGEFALDVTVSPREVDVGDPITVTSVVRGDGSLDGVTSPAIAGSEALRVYPVQAGRDDATGARTFEQAVVPLGDGRLVVDGPTFSYFDPRAHTYRTLAPEPVSVNVRPSVTAGAQPQIVGAAPATTSKRAETLGRDLVFIKDAPGALRPAGARLYHRGDFWLWHLAPVLIWLGASGYDRRRRRIAGDTRYARFTRAGRNARAEIARAREALARDDLAACRDVAAGAIRSYLAAKLDLPPGAVDESAPGKLQAASVDTSLVEQVRAFFAGCEHARFAPGAVTRTDIEATLTQAEAILRGLERTRRIKHALPSSPVSTVVVAMALTAATLATAATSDDNPTALFFRANALYSAEQYAEASALYEKILAADVESGAVHYNLGNAYFKTGDVGRAVLSYERAARLIPADPDLAANLAYARELAADAPVESVITRVTFPLANRLDTDRLLLLATFVWWVGLLTLAAARLLPSLERPSRWIAGAAGLLLVLSLSSAAYRYRTIELPRWAVVTAAAETTVRYEPSPSGTAFFAARPGTVLRVLGEREGWLQVAGRDGRRGWVEAAVVSRL